MTSKSKTIVFVEDEVEVAKIVRDYLERAHYSVELFNTGIGVVDRVRDDVPDLLLLDIMLPGVDGTTICREIRAFSTVPIIMITARVDELDRLVGYELGVDDYICKPVNPREILARVKAVLRRADPPTESTYRTLVLDVAKHLAIYKGARLDLTPTEFNVLNLLASGDGRIFSREEIIDLINDESKDASERAVDTCVKKLRKKMAAVADGANPIRSVYGMGYKYEDQ